MKSPVIVAELITRGATPEFVTLSDLGVLGVPMTCCAVKTSVEGTLILCADAGEVLKQTTMNTNTSNADAELLNAAAAFEM